MTKSHLLIKLFIAIALGIGFGFIAPDWAIRLTNSFSGLFGQYIRFIVPFIIVGLVTPAIAETGKNAGKMLLLTMALAYGSTLFAGYFAYVVADFAMPCYITGSLKTVAAKTLPSFINLQIPPIMDVTTALVVAMMFGLSIVVCKSETLAKVFGEMRDVVTLTIEKSMIPLLPAFIFSVIANLTACGRLTAVGHSCIRIMITAFAVCIVVLLVQFTVAGIVARRNPFKALWIQLPAYLTGFGCCSSAATIPVNLRQTMQNGVSKDTADLVIPLCANVHLAGSMANMVIYTAGILLLLGQQLPIANYTQFILMVSIVAVASPGVPGGVVLASATIAETALGLSAEHYAIVIAIYLALDGMGTACNLTGDGAIAIVVDRFRRRTTK